MRRPPGTGSTPLDAWDRVLFDIILVAAALTTALVAGLLLTFAVVVMPGLGTLDDRAFLRGFAVVDRVIQDVQPVFALVWGGSVVAVAVALPFGVAELEGGQLATLVIAATLYLLGVQGPTALVNVPLNNRIQVHDLHTASPLETMDLRQRFEAQWNRWNAIRTVCAVAASVLLLLLLLWR